MQSSKKIKSKKVLIITYYWPPSGGGGVQRWLKFSKYLPDFGWEPVIYTPEDPDFELKDFDLLNDVSKDIEVVKRPIWEPFKLYRKFTGESAKVIQSTEIKGANLSWKKRLSIWIRGHFFIPDTRCFWIKPSIRFLNKYIVKNDIDIVVSTGPPQSMHLIGRSIKRKNKDVTWIADFRDPWTNVGSYKELKLDWLTDKIHRNLERSVIREADCVLTVSEPWSVDYTLEGAKKVCTITNGFDAEDFKVIPTVRNVSNEFKVSHIGTFGWSRNPNTLWQVLSDEIANNKSIKEKLKINLVGSVDDRVLNSIKEWGLGECLNFSTYIPHNEAINQQLNSDVLLLFLNDDRSNALGRIPAKVFEYLIIGKPILAIGPTDSEIANILDKTSSGKCFDYSDYDGIKSFMNDLIESKEKFKFLKEEIYKYERKNLTKRLSELFDEFI